MNDRRTILVVDDDEISLELLTRYLQNHGLSVLTARDGQEALKIHERDPAPVVLTDLNMPVLDGHGLVQELQKKNDPPMILVETMEQDLNTAVGLMREGVYDYLTKPIRERELLLRVDHAFEHHESLRLRAALEREREFRLERQLNWNVWKESVASRSADRYDRNLFHNLRVCFTQGAGFGGLVAVTELMSAVAEKRDGQYLIPEEIMEEIFSNAETARRSLEEFGELNEILNAELPLEATSFPELQALLEEVVEQTKPLAAHKHQTLKTGSAALPGAGNTLMIHRPYMERAIKELLVNACKFSRERSEILILTKLSGEKLLLTVLNQPEAGIDLNTPGFDSLIFEPFFRLTGMVDERYGTLDYGLGLTLVDKIVRGHHGRVTSSLVRYHLNESDGEEYRINMEMELPASAG